MAVAVEVARRHEAQAGQAARHLRRGKAAAAQAVQQHGVAAAACGHVVAAIAVHVVRHQGFVVAIDDGRVRQHVPGAQVQRQPRLAANGRQHVRPALAQVAAGRQGRGDDHAQRQPLHGAEATAVLRGQQGQLGARGLQCQQIGAAVAVHVLRGQGAHGASGQLQGLRRGELRRVVAQRLHGRRAGDGQHVAALHRAVAGRDLHRHAVGTRRQRHGGGVAAAQRPAGDVRAGLGVGQRHAHAQRRHHVGHGGAVGRCAWVERGGQAAIGQRQPGQRRVALAAQHVERVAAVQLPVAAGDLESEGVVPRRQRQRGRCVARQHGRAAVDAHGGRGVLGHGRQRDAARPAGRARCRPRCPDARAATACRWTAPAPPAWRFASLARAPRTGCSRTAPPRPAPWPARRWC